MDVRRYVRIPGDQTHELPPLLVRHTPESPEISEVVSRAAEIIDAEDMLPDATGQELAALEQRRFELQLNLAEQYMSVVAHWQWGDSILEWIRQCEITFESRETLRSLLRPDVWPHAGRSSFVTLLVEKQVPTPVQVEKAVGLRLTFRQPPPIDCFSDQFLFYLNSPLAGTAYHKWSHMTRGATALLPPERFYFQVFDLR
jgi:hypothetical protein